MHELDPPHYRRVRSLLGEMSFHLAVKAILEGSATGRVYADHPHRPKAALACTGQRFYLAGSVSNGQFNPALRHLFSNIICPTAPQEGQKASVLYYAPPDWELQIYDFLKGRSPVPSLRAFFTLRVLRHDWRTLLPDRFCLRTVDGALLAEGHLRNLGLLTKEICSERASVRDFLDRSFGVCLLHGDEIVGWCLSEYNSGDCCEVGIGTLEPYRRRGLATCMASALVEQALARGISQVGWHCWANNAPSVATALKVGFERVKDYPVFIVR